MAHFASAHGNKPRGYPKINLDLVERLEPAPRHDNELPAWDCFNAQGDRIGSISGCEIPEPVQCVPNTHLSVVLIEFWYDSQQGEIATFEHPVLAWKIDPELCAEPVIAEALPDAWCLKYEDDRYLFPGEFNASSMPAAIDYARDRVAGAEAMRAEEHAKSQQAKR